MPYKKDNIRVFVPKRSGFDKSHRYTFCGVPGTLYPVMCDEVIPNTPVYLKPPFTVQVMPLVTDTYMSMHAELQAFFVPLRLLAASFQDWFNDKTPQIYRYDADIQANDIVNVKPALPTFYVSRTSAVDSGNKGVLGRNTLADYLGLSTIPSDWTQADHEFSLLPFIAYHLVWSEWYRQPNVQKPAFVPAEDVYPKSTNMVQPQSAPFYYFNDDDSSLGTNYGYKLYVTTTRNFANLRCADNWPFFALRQRNYGLDYFTGARLSPQSNGAASVSIPVVSTPGTFA